MKISDCKKKLSSSSRSETLGNRFQAKYWFQYYASGPSLGYSGVHRRNKVNNLHAVAVSQKILWVQNCDQPTFIFQSRLPCFVFCYVLGRREPSGTSDERGSRQNCCSWSNPALPTYTSWLPLSNLDHKVDI